MKWMRERDLLIAQTMAFVQSVTGKKPEAENTVATSVTLLPVETSSTANAPAPMPDIEALLAVSGAVAEPPKPAPMPRPDRRDDFQSEIKARVANFRAHQERFNREREAYCSATMAKVHAALKASELPPRLGK
ncbi:hypothetical protein ACFIOY_32595 [Bradyrhizobium sp. TZ2]